MEDSFQTPANNLIYEKDQHSYDGSESIIISSAYRRPDADKKVGIEISDRKGIDQQPQKTRSKWYFLLLPLAIITWPIIKIISNKKYDFQFIEAVFSLITMIAIVMHVFPISLVIYFSITYVVAVCVEFSIFVDMPSDEKIFDAIKKALEKSGEIIPTDQVTIKKHVELFGREPSRLWNTKYAGAFAMSIGYLGIVLFGLKNGGFDDPWVWIGAMALMFATLTKGLHLHKTYSSVYSLLKYSTELLETSLGKYDKEAIYQLTSRIKKSTSFIAEMCKACSLLEISDTISFFWILFIVLATSLFDIQVITSYLGSGNSELAETTAAKNFRPYNLTCQFYLYASAMLFISKLWAGYQRNSLHEKVESEFNEITSQFSYISKLPESFISIPKDGKIITPHFNEIIKWEDIQVSEINDEEYLQKREEEPIYLQKKYNAEYLLTKIKEQEGVTEVSYRELLVLLSEQARKSSERLSLVVGEFQKFYQKVEYKLFGYWSINDTLISKLAMTVGTSVVAYIFTYLSEHFDFQY